MARVVDSPEGPRYQSRVPILDPGSRRLFVTAENRVTSLPRLGGKRLRELRDVRYEVDVVLDSEEAEKIPGSADQEGSLPAACETCHETRLIPVQEVRWAVAAEKGSLTL